MKTGVRGFPPRIHPVRRWAVALIFAVLNRSAAAAGVPGDFDAAPFGTVSIQSPAADQPVFAPQLTDGDPRTAASVPSGGSIRVEWREPRDVFLVQLRFAAEPPPAAKVSVQYWYSVWPDNGGGGWMKVDDPFNGEFIRAAVDSRVETSVLSLRFMPLQKAENPKIKSVGHDWRRTYQVRVGFEADVRLTEIECFTDSEWRPATVRVDLKQPGWDGRVEPRSASVLSTEAVGGAYVFKVRYGHNPDRLSSDRGHLIVRRGPAGQDFSFFIEDVLMQSPLRIRGLDACVSDPTQPYSCAHPPRPVDAWDATVMEQVAAMPEQTFERAMREIPPKWIGDLYLGLPVLRQEISMNASSQIYTELWCLRGPAADVSRSPMLTREREQRVYNLVTRQEPFGPPSPNAIRRWLEGGYLPVVYSVWQQEGIEYEQTVYVTALDPAVLAMSLEPPRPPARPLGEGVHAADFGSGLRGDEPIAALSRLEIRNPSGSERTATMWLKITQRPPMRIDEHGLLILEKPTRPAVAEDLIPTWGQIDTRGRGELAYLKDHFPDNPDRKEPRDLIRYTVTLKAGEKHTIILKVPYIEQMTPAEIRQLKALDWEQGHPRVVELWKRRLAAAIDDYRVPQPELMNLYRANLWHVLITTDRDVPTGLYEHGASTCHYPMYANETMMVMRSLEMRGEHEEARRLIEPYLLSQGAKPLPGNFKSQDGLLYAAAPKGHDHYTAQGYNMHHGFLLWAAAEHYLWTRDRAYLEAAAPHLVAACDWVTRERRATMVMTPGGMGHASTPPGGMGSVLTARAPSAHEAATLPAPPSRPLEYGLAPAGDLEDVGEYLWWYPTNAYYYLGMKTAADALADIGHPEAPRLAADAKAYRDDILASVREATAASPVVRLLDGTYVPYVPPRPYVLTDRKEGWIRESLYCALHLVDAGLISPDESMTTWILHDLEDRIFMSEESGYGPRHGLTSPREQFFSLGGFNPQPNLLSTPLVYLQRGQVPNFLRGFFNTFAVSYYPDTCCFIEALLTFGQGHSPLYKTPDESRFIQTMRQMLVLEMGDSLYLARGVPRAWTTPGKTVQIRNASTYFGPVSLQITSEADGRTLRAQIELPTRNPPKHCYLSLRHPEARKIRSLRVNDQPHARFDPASGQIELPAEPSRVEVVAQYE